MDSPLGAPLEVGSVVLRNRFVATAHASGHTRDGLPVDGDAEYWKRVADGGAAMLISGGTAPAPESTPRRRNLVECWRPEVVEGWSRRVDAIHSGGGVAISQFVHLGRETLGAESWYAPVAPSAVRSPREPTTPRPLTDGEIEAVVEGHHASTTNAVEAGFDGVELHAAHGYLLSQFLSPATNLRDNDADGRVALTQRILRTMRDAAPGRILGVRFSLGGEHEAGLDLAGLFAVLDRVADLVDYVNLTVGVRNTYVRDMATERPPLLDDIARLREHVRVPMVAGQAFRDQADMEAALAAGADLIGMARPYIADPELPSKLLSGRAAQVRPCVSCNEDCRVFDPCLLCSVNPDLAPPGAKHRPAIPLRVGAAAAAPGRVAVVGAGPAGLECALRLAQSGIPVTVFDEGAGIGGQLAIATAAPNRSGWARLLAFYASELERLGADVLLGHQADAESLAPFDEVVVAIGAEEARPDVPGAETALRSSDLLVEGPSALRGVQRLVVVDDGWGWWPCVSAVEAGVAAGVTDITVVSPSNAFAGAIPAESRVQFLARLGDARLQVLGLQRLEAVDAGGLELRGVPGGAATRVEADAVVLVGERRARSWAWLGDRPGVQAVGDCLVPRRVQHAVSEGCAAAEAIVAARNPVPALN
jgi:2,4-dienoyl-CoA reductase-like NADH-dependent reductase (Old Yellow Enzyme family)/NADPH-dependent 2,4-dienoyl-CoA reductase/sulfur reductase-like enzyme